MLNDTDIEKAITARQQNSAEGIFIEEFEEESLTPIGYDLRVGKEYFSWKKQRIFPIKDENPLNIKANDTVVIRTYESVKLSKKIGATIHSMATKVSFGLSHISTTVDPGWTGTMLITVHNYRNDDIELKFKERFCTICFHEMKLEATRGVRSDHNREDIWSRLREIDNKTIKQQRIFVTSCIFLFFILAFFIYIKYPSLFEWLQKFLKSILELIKLIPNLWF